MDLFSAIKNRRTIKTFRPEALPDEQLMRILSAARWVPNHRLTQPWRLRIIGPKTLENLVAYAGPAGKKLQTAPHLILVSFYPSPIPLHAREDEQSTAAAIYAILLAATAENVGSFWRTPKFLREKEGLRIANIPEKEQALGLIYLGYSAGELPEPKPLLDLDKLITMLP